MAQEIVIGQQELLAKFQRMGEAVQGQALADTAMAGGYEISNSAKVNAQKNFKGEGNLSRSIHPQVTEQTSTQATVQVGTDVIYAAIHEFGGTIKPVSAKYLAIPVGSYQGSPRDHTDLKPRKTGDGWVLVDEAGSVQYVLKASVTVPAQPYLRPAFDNQRERAVSVMGETFKGLIMAAAE